jgi:tRNA 2-thiocytidine biosynthesis protein TtcA
MSKQASKLEKKLLRLAGQAISDFQMIEEGDRVMVAISGGKDSWCMLHVLETLQRRAPISFELLAVHLYQGEPYALPHANQIEAALEAHGAPYHVARRNIHDVVETKLQPGQIRCSLCSRLRRGALYDLAVELGCTKIALGHHRDDLIETLLLNQFFTGRIASMPPKLVSDDKRNTVIRPLCYVPEDDLRTFVPETGYPVFPCLSCDTINGKRVRIKQLIKELEVDIPDVRQSLLRSMSHIRPSQMLDRDLWSFAGTAASTATASAPASPTKADSSTAPLAS